MSFSFYYVFFIYFVHCLLLLFIRFNVYYIFMFQSCLWLFMICYRCLLFVLFFVVSIDRTVK